MGLFILKFSTENPVDTEILYEHFRNPLEHDFKCFVKLTIVIVNNKQIFKSLNTGQFLFSIGDESLELGDSNIEFLGQLFEVGDSCDSNSESGNSITIVFHNIFIF